MSPLAAELLDTLRQIGPASSREVREDYERRAKMGLVESVDPIAIDEAWLQLSRLGRIKLTGGAWEWVPERRASSATPGRTQRSLFGG